MPFLDVKVSKPLDDAAKAALSKSLTKVAGDALGKGESWVMCNIQDNQYITFQNSTDPCVYMNVNVYGSPNGAAELTKKATDVVCLSPTSGLSSGDTTVATSNANAPFYYYYYYYCIFDMLKCEILQKNRILEEKWSEKNNLFLPFTSCFLILILPFFFVVPCHPAGPLIFLAGARAGPEETSKQKENTVRCWGGKRKVLGLWRKVYGAQDCTHLALICIILSEATPKGRTDFGEGAASQSQGTACRCAGRARFLDSVFRFGVIGRARPPGNGGGQACRGGGSRPFAGGWKPPAASQRFAVLFKFVGGGGAPPVRFAGPPRAALQQKTHCFFGKRGAFWRARSGGEMEVAGSRPAERRPGKWVVEAAMAMQNGHGVNQWVCGGNDSLPSEKLRNGRGRPFMAHSYSNLGAAREVGKKGEVWRRIRSLKAHIPAGQGAAGHAGEKI
eukprot:gene4437-3236_t